MLQSDTPLLTALQTCAKRNDANFHTPGHKRGQGLDDRLRSLLQQGGMADLPELPELDNLFAPASVIQQAQELAADAFGAERTWFLANGSTSGVIAALLATCQPGEKLILPRNVHRSAISGLILAGVIPVFVQPDMTLNATLPMDWIPQRSSEHSSSILIPKLFFWFLPRITGSVVILLVLLI